ncbi:hypothetical protein F4859DRAFT_376852 [Xylaria cf. heliscus]|nr:hypothetical protein F4859DRAFT_376852 [Xylaria cf. heliscus]
MAMETTAGTNIAIKTGTTSSATQALQALQRATGQPAPPIPAQAPVVHAQPGLVQAPQQPQLDPSQSQSHRQHAHHPQSHQSHQSHQDQGQRQHQQQEQQRQEQQQQQRQRFVAPSPSPLQQTQHALVHLAAAVSSTAHPHSPSPSPLHSHSHSHLHSHSHSRSNSYSHIHSTHHTHHHHQQQQQQQHQHQPYRNPSQPPRLPPLAVSLDSISLSPFDLSTLRDGDNNYSLSASASASAAASPAPATSTSTSASNAVLPIARLPVQTDDIVSPLSETRSSTPNFRSFDRGDEATAPSPAAQPSARFTALTRQPASHSSAGASVLDDRDFELSLRATGTAEHPATSPSRSVFAAVKSAVAHDVAHLTDEGSDDWFRFTARESTISRYTNNSHPEAHPHHMMAAATTANEPSMPELPHQGDRFMSATTSSFTPLPPIRRTSTFDLLRKKGLVDDDGDTVPSPIEKDGPPMPSGPAETTQQASNSQLPADQGASHSSPHKSVQLHPQPQPNLNLNPNPHGQSQSLPAMPPQPNGPVPAAGPPGQPGMPQPPIAQMHPHQMMMGRGGPAGQQVPPSHMTVNGRGQTVISLPGGRQWTEQESHLAEPLNPSNRNRSANSPQTYPAYDKETEGDGPPPSHLGAPSLPFPARPRTTSNPVPPTAATRYPQLFPNPAQQNAFLRNQGQVPLPHHPLLRAQNGSARPRNSFDDGSLSKETMGVRVDQVSLSSVTSEDVNDKRRGSGSLFNLGHRRDSSSVAATQLGSSDASPEKKKKNIFASVANMAHSQPKPRSNLGLARPSTFDDSDQVSLQNSRDNIPPKKRLSELKGMIMGVGNAKEGVKDDQPVRVETVYESRQSIQSLPQNTTTLPGMQGTQRPSVSFGPPAQPGPFVSQGQAYPPGPQGSMQPGLSQMGQPMGTSPPPFMGVVRASTAGPHPGQVQQVKGEESGKKSSGGGFLGGLFHKQGNKTKDVKQQSPQQTPPSSQRPTQPPTQSAYVPFRPGQIGQPIGPHPMFAGQPQVQRGPPGPSPSPPLFQDPSQPAPSLQKAQVVTIRRPSGITVSSTQSIQGVQQSSNQRPNMPSPQGSQGPFKQQAGPSPLGHRPSQMDLQNENGIVASQVSPQFSDDSPLERPVIGNSALVPRFSPNRKPVGSGNPRDAPFMTSAIPPGATRPERTASQSPKQGEQRAPSQLSYVQQSSHRESSGGLNDTRQPSLPSPEPSPVPSQSNQSSSPGLQGGQFARDSPNPRDSGQGLGVFPNGISPTGPMNASGPNGAPGGLVWGPNGARPMVPPLTSPSTAARIQPPRTPSSPASSVDQGKLSRFFGAYDGGKPAAQPQTNKEKSAASKFLGAFKRSSKQSEAPTSQPRPQTSPRAAQQAMRPGVPGSAAPGAIPGIQGPSGAPTGQVRLPPVQSGQGRGSIPMQMQAGRGQLSQMPPPGIPMPIQAQAGRGQFPPGMMMQGGLGPQTMVAGAGPVPSYMQRPTAPGKQGNEPQYDQVPIPPGYDAVHGYGPGGMLAYSPYNVGRPGNPPIQYAQFPPAVQPGFPQRQWDPRLMQSAQAGLPPGTTTPRAPQILPQGVPNNIPYQGIPQQPQLQGPSQTPSPTPPYFQSNAAQNLPSSQQFHPSQPAYQSGQISPPEQGQMPTQPIQNPQIQQSQPQEQGFQQDLGPDSQAQSNVSWTATPQSRQSPSSFQQPNLAPNPVPQTSVRAVSISGSPSSSGSSSTQSLHIPPTTQIQQPPSVHSNSTHQSSPVNQIVNPSTQVSSQGASRSPTQSPSATSGLLRSPDAARLTSRMSVSRHANNSHDLSFGPEKPADRTLTVSPEPPGPYHGPIHQVSEQTLGVDVDRANSHIRHASEDIYDATPRLNSSIPDSAAAVAQENGNTKYMGSEKGRGFSNTAPVGIGIAGVAVGAGAGATTAAVVAEDNMSFLDGPDSEPDETTVTVTTEEEQDPVSVSPPQQQATPTMMNLEPEEKILVDQPVELAAVNDDDDGIPMMTATSYPGQEWNPYGAGEFGDWE